MLHRHHDIANKVTKFVFCIIKNQLCVWHEIHVISIYVSAAILNDVVWSHSDTADDIAQLRIKTLQAQVWSDWPFNSLAPGKFEQKFR